MTREVLAAMVAAGVSAGAVVCAVIWSFAPDESNLPSAPVVSVPAPMSPGAPPMLRQGNEDERVAGVLAVHAADAAEAAPVLTRAEALTSELLPQPMAAKATEPAAPARLPAPSKPVALPSPGMVAVAPSDPAKPQGLPAAEGAKPTTPSMRPDLPVLREPPATRTPRSPLLARVPAVHERPRRPAPYAVLRGARPWPTGIEGVIQPDALIIRVLPRSAGR
jgi:hypothetical protein